MNVYFIRRHDALVGAIGWDETASAVVVAESKHEARLLMVRRSYKVEQDRETLDHAGEEGAHPWLTSVESSVFLLGPYTGAETKAHLVCRDFKRG